MIQKNEKKFASIWNISILIFAKIGKTFNYFHHLNDTQSNYEAKKCDK